jgi:hypothetical protein
VLLSATSLVGGARRVPIALEPCSTIDGRLSHADFWWVPCGVLTCRAMPSRADIRCCRAVDGMCGSCRLREVRAVFGDAVTVYVATNALHFKYWERWALAVGIPTTRVVNSGATIADVWYVFRD